MRSFLGPLSYLPDSRIFQHPFLHKRLASKKIGQTLRISFYPDPTIDYTALYGKTTSLADWASFDYGRDTLRVVRTLNEISRDWKSYKGPLTKGQIKVSTTKRPPKAIITFFQGALRNPREEVQGFLEKMSCSPMDREEILIEASKTSEKLFVSLLHRFHFEGYNLSSKALETIFMNLHRSESVAGIRSLTRVCPERPQGFWGLNVWLVKSLDMIEALKGFFRCSSRELGQLLTGHRSAYQEPKESLPLDVIKAFINDLGITPAWLLQWGTFGLRGEAFQYAFSKLEPEELPSDFLGWILWILLHEETTDPELEILLRAYPRVADDYLFPCAFIHDTPSQVFHKNNSLYFTTTQRASSYLELLYGSELKQENIKELLQINGEGPPTGKILSHPLLLGQLCLRARETLETPEFQALLMGSVKARLQTTKSPLESPTFDSILILLEELPEFRKVFEGEMKDLYDLFASYKRIQENNV